MLLRKCLHVQIVSILCKWFSVCTVLILVKNITSTVMSTWVCSYNYDPQPGVWGIYYFLVWILTASVSAPAFFSVHYLLNQLMDFDQTCIDTFWGEGKKLIRFW